MTGRNPSAISKLFPEEVPAGQSQGRARLVLLALLLSLLSVNACVLLPVIEAVKKSGATESDRMALLSQDIKQFTDYLSWADKVGASQFVADEARAEIMKQYSDIGQSERIIESQLNDVRWEDSAHVAKVALRVKYFKVPFYVVNIRTENQEWVFAMSTGWKLKERKVEES